MWLVKWLVQSEEQSAKTMTRKSSGTHYVISNLPYDPEGNDVNIFFECSATSIMRSINYPHSQEIVKCFSDPDTAKIALDNLGDSHLGLFEIQLPLGSNLSDFSVQQPIMASMIKSVTIGCSFFDAFEPKKVDNPSFESEKILSLNKPYCS